ncbi:glycosyl transferase family 2 [Hallella multisaccharivorax DSM 17128]|uniref:Glycosyl transferase family 2 n=2 Tax=Hallella multisaccharivorax TaxID=310514 RepID=F8N5T2_9BACT|nr:glycosyl transferase family 2 [Hallella multisaccharivorax DSM 17128]
MIKRYIRRIYKYHHGQKIIKSTEVQNTNGKIELFYAKARVLQIMKGLSILIPVYCDSCVDQVKQLCRQCLGLKMLWEIIVADDGSPGAAASLNDEVAEMEGCRLIKRPVNIGRAAIRNFLAHEARFDTLIYMDAGMIPSEDLVGTYMRYTGKAKVVCGSIGVSKDCIDDTNLRCLNELKAEKAFSLRKRNMSPYTNFHSGNFMIDRMTMLDNPFSEKIKTYGYEDTLLGKSLADKHVSIIHIDNPLFFVHFESNARFLEKTEEALRTLYDLREELQGYSSLLRLVSHLQRYHLLWITVWIKWLYSRSIKNNLLGPTPKLFLFNIFRICYLSGCFL